MRIQSLPRDFTLRKAVMNLKLRRTWFDALVYIRDHGSVKWQAEFTQGKGRAGSRIRMLRRIHSCGYIAKVLPDSYALTMQGHRYIKVCKDQFGWPDYRDPMMVVPLFVETGNG